jgi:signal transduction histidine kinase
MSDGGTLSIAAHATNGVAQLELKITDTGRGMTETRLEQIFKPFVTDKRAGLGLGLPLVKRLVERLGGTVALSSQQGRGTTAFLRLPGVTE